MNKEVEEAKEVLKSYRNAIDTFGTIDYKCINNLYKPSQILLNYIQELEEQVEYDKTHIFTPQTINLNYILKQEIRDKMIAYFDYEDMKNEEKDDFDKFLQELLNEEE